MTLESYDRRGPHLRIPWITITVVARVVDPNPDQNPHFCPKPAKIAKIDWVPDSKWTVPGRVTGLLLGGLDRISIVFMKNILFLKKNVFLIYFFGNWNFGKLKIWKLINFGNFEKLIFWNFKGFKSFKIPTLKFS